ncbi:MAG: hypothetical protein P8J80_10800 [Porticoccaceae bacterium]|nr:hypothetical protein [Porticoccaceae bacterium]
MTANRIPHRLPLRWSTAVVLSLVLTACQMPSYTPPAGSSAPSGSSGGASGGGIPSSPSGGSTGGMPSPSGSQGGSQGGIADDSSGGSSGQSLEDLDQALEDSLEGFDDTVGSQGATGAEIDILSPSGSRGGVQVDSDTPLFEEDGSGTMAEDTMAEGTMAEGNAEIESRAAEGPQSEASESGAADASAVESGALGAASDNSEGGDIVPIPEDIGDGQGDDIVMRQIRNAAMQESDPVLREKLWDEYRRMKNQ